MQPLFLFYILQQTFCYLCNSMDRKLRKQIASLILTFGLVFPMLVGFIHALHDHDQIVCLAENESHIHRQGMDCNHLHYFNPGGVLENEAAFEKLISAIDPIASWGNPCAKSKNLVSNLTLRGPPMIHV